jgi:plasmid stabilization system protein ParE
MKIVIRQKADDDLDGIFAWIEKDNPRAAVEVIRAGLEGLARRHARQF